MNIKSEFLQKTVPWIPSITLAMVLVSVALGSFMALVIIGIGWGILVKLVAAVGGSIIVLVWAFDKSITPEEDRDKVMKQGLIMFLLTFIIAEIPLFYKSSTVTTISVQTVWSKEIRNERIPNSDPSEYKDVPYEKVAFYNAETNDRMGSRNIEANEQNKKKLYIDVIGKEMYIDYFPFFTYSEEYRYIRKKNPTNDSKL